MKRNRSFVFCTLMLGVVVAAVFLARQSLAGREIQTGPAAVSREDAYRENNIGVALLEQFKYKEAVEAFKRALQIDAKLSLAHINLSIALYNVPDLPGAEREAKTALTFAHNAPQPYYILGLIAKTPKHEEAIAAFQHVLKIDPKDEGTNINLGQIYSQQKKYPEAIAAFRIAIAVEPYNGTALYNLGQALMRAGQREEGQAVTQRFKELRGQGSANTIGNNYLEQGRYAETGALTRARFEIFDLTIPAVTFSNATTRALPSSDEDVRIHA